MQSRREKVSAGLVKVIKRSLVSLSEEVIKPRG
jgi:hypothetical protein